MAAIIIVMSISPMLIPLAGSFVLVWGGWRDIFLLLAVAALCSLTLILLVLPETHPAARRKPMRLVQFCAEGLGMERLIVVALHCFAATSLILTGPFMDNSVLPIAAAISVAPGSLGGPRSPGGAFAAPLMSPEY